MPLIFFFVTFVVGEATYRCWLASQTPLTVCLCAKISSVGLDLHVDRRSPFCQVAGQSMADLRENGWVADETPPEPFYECWSLFEATIHFDVIVGIIPNWMAMVRNILLETTIIVTLFSNWSAPTFSTSSVCPPQS